MSTFGKEIKECAICGKKHESMVIMSTNSFGSSDLDTRPPQMIRSTLPYQIELCDECGYANLSIDCLLSDETERIINGPVYRSIFLDETINRTSKAFLLAGSLYNLHEEYKIGGVFYLKAAWAFDDHNDIENAILARKKAITAFNKYLKQEFTEEGILYRFNNDKQKEDLNIKMVIIDLLRRSESFDEAKSLAKELSKKVEDNLSKEILAFQIKLSRKKDSTCHKVSEAKKIFLGDKNG